MLFDAEFWVAIAFVMFIAILGYVGVHRRVLDALDRRGIQIKRELDGASGLKKEAEALLREAYRKRREIEHEVDSIINSARAERRHLVAEAKAKVEEFVRRRTELAETRLARAERQAVADVRAAAAEVAVSAAEEVLMRSLNGKDADKCLMRSIEAVKTELSNK